MRCQTVCRSASLVILSLIACTKECRADFVFNGISQSGGNLYYIGTSPYMMGYRFTVGSSQLAVTSLGMFDSVFSTNQQGLFESHQVGLWNSSGTLLASVTVGAGTTVPLTNAFRYVQLASSVLLTPGQSYTIAAAFTTSYASNTNADLTRGLTGSEATSAISSLVSFNAGVYGAFGFGLPNTDFSDALVAANAQFSVVPVPSGVILAGLGIAGVALCKRKRTKKLNLSIN